MLGLPGAIEPGSYQSKILKTSAMLPFIGGYYAVKDYVLAGGFYALGGGGGKWEDSVSDALASNINASLKGECGYMVGNLSIAKKVNEKMSVGAGLNYIYILDEVNVEKEYQASDTALSSGISNYNFTLKRDGSGSAIGFILGTMCEPAEKIKIGLALRSGASVKLRGKASYVQSGLTALGYPDADVETDYDQNYAYPMTYDIGFAYVPIDALTLAFSITRADYSVLKDDFDYKTEVAGVLTDGNTSWKWKDTTEINTGAEYRLNQKFSVAGGVIFDPNPVPNDKLTFLKTNQYDLIVPNVGFGYTSGQLRLEFNRSFCISDKPSKGDRSQELSGGSYLLNLAYNF